MTEVVLHPRAHAKPPDNPHSFTGMVRVAPEDSLSGCEQREKFCPVCSLYKITLLPTGARRYRYGPDGDQFQAASDPPCLPKVTSSQGSSV